MPPPWLAVLPMKLQLVTIGEEVLICMPPPMFLNGSMLPKVAEFIITHHCRLLPIVVLQETWLGLVAEELETVVIPHQP